MLAMALLTPTAIVVHQDRLILQPHPGMAAHKKLGTECLARTVGNVIRHPHGQIHLSNPSQHVFCQTSGQSLKVRVRQIMILLKRVFQGVNFKTLLYPNQDRLMMGGCHTIFQLHVHRCIVVEPLLVHSLKELAHQTPSPKVH